MKNKILIGALVTMLTITSSGFAIYYDNTNILKEVIEEQKVDLKQKSTEIANLEEVVKNKDNDLKAKDMVIENKNAEINKLNDKIKKSNEKIEKLKKEISNFNNKSKGSDVPTTSSMTVDASGYIALCTEGCTGKTRSGYNVKNTIYYQGMRIIATDTDVIPMYSIVEIEGFSDKFIALDTGGYIEGNKIDILFESTNDAIEFGRKDLKLNIIRYGKG